MSLPTRPEGPRIFVSHSHNDNEFCRDYVLGLRSAGCDVWYDEFNLGWGALRATIEAEMPEREHFVTIFSPASVGSEWVNAEIDAALELLREGKVRTLTFVLAAPCSIPLLLRRWKRIEGSGGAAVSPDEAIQRTLAIVAPEGGLHYTPSLDAASVQLSTTAPSARSSSAIVPSSRFPARLAAMGYSAYSSDDGEWIVPPVCSVPAGPFRLGSERARDKEARGAELNRRVVTLATYEFARFPVTVAEYACFVNATHRTPPPKSVFNDLPWERQLERLHHPVAAVSWYDAYDYAAWLAQRTGQLWRLPTEAEWEKAARCDPRDPLGTSSERIYPWGDIFEAARCNTGDSVVKTTLPVGCYGPDDPDPRARRKSGASPCGAEDMAGNAWEWTASERAGDYSLADIAAQRDALAPRGLRGGAWDVRPRDARATYRNTDKVTLVSITVGFRLARGPDTRSL